MSNDAGQDYAIQTFDQQLYAIAQQVKWSKPDIFNRHILRLGGFHSLSCFLASIGKLWADGGLRDLLVDSGVYAGNTAELMLNGKEFNRAVRGFTLVFEALQVLFISAFIHWCRTFDYFDQIPSAFWNVLLEFHTKSRVVASGEEYCNSQGKWLRIKRFRVTSNEEEKFDNEAWIQQFSSKSSNDEAPVLVPVDKALKRTNPISNWEEVVEQHFAIQLPKKKLDIMAADEEAVDKLRQVPANWSIECEEALVRLMSQHIPPENDHLGSIKNYVEAVDVSSCCDESTGSSPLTDGDPDTYWESDGSAGRHWIELKMKKGAVISELKVTLDGSDDNYLPRKLVVEGGEPNNFTVLNTVNITWEISDVEDIPLLENSTEHYPYIMIRIKECKSGGIDTRIREIKITASEGRYMGFDMDVFKKDNLVRFPKLESYTSEQLYRRSILIQRFISILDNVLKYLVPSWKYSVGSYSSLEFIRQLLPLSKKRMHLIETFVKESATE
ncbi:HECTD3 [Mytilus edulis]|uniref:HECTD3 n=1 Tax=Mytilus edulis TaxID=6550 RepID=A0A8S3QF87_MYTED|nr:HECTD3 [Mytilus edulis]